MTNAQSRILINPFTRLPHYPSNNPSSPYYYHHNNNNITYPYHSSSSSQHHSLLRTIWNSVFNSIKTLTSWCFLLPIRLVGLSVTLTATNIFARVALLGHKHQYDPDSGALEPLPRWRVLLFIPAAISFRVAMFFMGFYRIKVCGAPMASREEAPIIIANHTSPFDPFYIALRHLPMIIARSEQRNTPLFGSLFEASQSILVDRADKNSRRHTAAEIKRRAKDDRFPQILLFPEGTTTNGTALVNFKTGAFLAGVPVQPIVVRYPPEKNSYNLSWTPGVSLGKFMFRAMLQFENFMEVEYLPVYKPSEEEKKDPSLYAKNVRAYMAKHMNVPVTEHSMQDMLLLDRAMRRNRSFSLPAELTITDLMQRSSHLKFEKNHNDFFTLLRIFQEMDDRGENLLDIHQFEKSMLRAFTHDDLGKQKSLSVAVQSRFLSYTRKLFRLLCNEDGKLDYKAFVLGVAPFMVSPEENEESKQIFLRAAFKAFDLDQDGYVSEEELRNTMQRINPYLSLERLDHLCKVMFKELDQDGDHRLSYAEFENGLENNEYLKGLFHTTRYTIQQLIRQTDEEVHSGKKTKKQSPESV